MWATARRMGAALAGAAVLAGGLLARPALAADLDIAGQSTFVTEDKSLAFGFTVNSTHDDDIFFSLRVPTDVSWGAVGLGAKGMRGSLILMIYHNEAGDNVTFSPRIAYDHYEPKHYPDFEYSVLNGTGVSGNYMTFSGHCHSGCQSWPAPLPGGYMDVSSNSQPAIYALGPRESLTSNDPAAPVKMHAEFGTFEIDMRRTFGNTDSPSLSEESVSKGTTAGETKTGLVDAMSTAHAVFMVLVFVVLLPLGALLPRFADSVKGHGVVQGVSLVGGLVGFGLGVRASFNYQRSRGFISAHQIIGIIVIAALIAQFVIGLLHHLKYQKTGMTTKLAPIHIWTGRVLIPLGIINAFLGFLFSLNSWRNIILAILLVVIAAVTAFLFFSRLRRNRRLRRRESSPVFGFTSGPDNKASGGSGARYADDGSGAAVGLREYAPSPAQIDLMDVSGGHNLGPEQKGRDFL